MFLQAKKGVLKIISQNNHKSGKLFPVIVGYLYVCWFVSRLSSWNRKRFISENNLKTCNCFSFKWAIYVCRFVCLFFGCLHGNRKRCFSSKRHSFNTNLGLPSFHTRNFSLNKILILILKPVIDCETVRIFSVGSSHKLRISFNEKTIASEGIENKPAVSRLNTVVQHCWFNNVAIFSSTNC